MRRREKSRQIEAELDDMNRAEQGAREQNERQREDGDGDVDVGPHDVCDSVCTGESDQSLL